MGEVFPPLSGVSIQRTQLKPRFAQSAASCSRSMLAIVGALWNALSFAARLVRYECPIEAEVIHDLHAPGDEERKSPKRSKL